MASEVFSIQEHTLPCSHIREYPRATAHSQEDVLSLCIKHYTPRGQDPATIPDDAVTVIGGHANGFPKELYEPLWIELHRELRSRGKTLRGIWIADSAQQGQSGVINEAILGNEPSWFDHSRDLFLMINHFRDQIRRPIVGIGHSMGSVQLLNLSIMHPRLFTTLIIIEPVMIQQQDPKDLDPERASQYFIPARMSIKRRDKWSSRQEAGLAFSRSAFYRGWDPRVIALWGQYGLRDLPTPHHRDRAGVTLTTTKHQEVASFARYNDTASEHPRMPRTLDVHPMYNGSRLYRAEPGDMFRRLPEVRPSVLYVFGKHSWTNSPGERIAKVRATGTAVGGSGGAVGGRVKAVAVEAGHLVPMERVNDTAAECTGWICAELEIYSREEATFRKQWYEGVDVGERSKVDHETESELGREPVRGVGTETGPGTGMVKGSKAKL